MTARIIPGMSDIPGAREIPDPWAEMERLAAARKQAPDVAQLRHDMDVLLAVATLYLVARHGKRY
jgi:hypothetical protein